MSKIHLVGACFLVLFAIALAPALARAAPCRLLPVTTWYNTIFAGAYRLEFDDPDPPRPHGFVWVSKTPMRILQPDGHFCRASNNVDIVTLPIFIAAGRYLYINTYGGSVNILFVVDARTCRTLWESPELYGIGFGRTKTGFYLPGAGWLTIRADCLPGKIIGKPLPPRVAPP
jgi:hypothetical protein